MICIARQQERVRLTRGIGEIDDKLTEVLDQNDELRAQLGMEQMPLVDVSELREKLKIRNQSYRAENDILRAEVERLEDERIQLKIQVRRAAQNSLQRAQDQGLTHEQIVLVDEYIETLKLGANPKRSMINSPRKDRPWPLSKDTEELQIELRTAIEDNAKFRQEISRLQERIASLKDENETFREVISDISHGKDSTSPELKPSPSLTKLIKTISQSKSVEELDLAKINDQVNKRFLALPFVTTFTQIVLV